MVARVCRGQRGRPSPGPWALLPAPSPHRGSAGTQLPHVPGGPRPQQGPTRPKTQSQEYRSCGLRPVTSPQVSAKDSSIPGMRDVWPASGHRVHALSSWTLKRQLCTRHATQCWGLHSEAKTLPTATMLNDLRHTSLTLSAPQFLHPIGRASALGKPQVPQRWPAFRGAWEAPPCPGRSERPGFSCGLGQSVPQFPHLQSEHNDNSNQAHGVVTGIHELTRLQRSGDPCTGAPHRCHALLCPGRSVLLRRQRSWALLSACPPGRRAD